MPGKAPELNVSVTFRHTESTEALKSYAIEKVSHCLNKYLSGYVDVQIVLAVEKRDQIVEVKVKSKDIEATSKTTTEDLYSSIDKVIDTLETQIRKQKEILRSHRNTPTRDLAL